MNPSYQHYATHDESEYPHLWRGVVGAWAPCLGPSGTRLHDHSGRANWGTLTNMDAATDWVVSQGQYALDFDGSNDYLQTTNTDNSLFSGRLTISAWVSFRQYTGTQAVVSNLGSSDGTFQLEFSRSAGKISFLQNGSTIGITSTQTIGDAGWRHVAVTRSGTTGDWTLATFINTQQTTVTTAANPASPTVAGPVVIGRAGGLNLQYLNGLVSDITIWNRPLHVNEIRELYQIGRGGMYTPRRRRRAYFGPLFQAGWARGSNVILQPCGVS